MNSMSIRKIIFEMASQSETLREVEKNFFNNTWWPLDIEDYRKRMIIAGLSSRISYNMINKYNEVCRALDSYTFEELYQMQDKKIIKIIKPLGLANTRIKFLKTMCEYLISRTKKEIFEANEEVIIEDIVQNVHGASYKVAQCCLLYAKSYFCGIFPIDSGMKDVLLPCLGFNQYGPGKGHEQLRKEITKTILKDLDNFTEELEIRYPIFLSNNSNSKADIVIWWSHLVMIYFKRVNCNKKRGTSCTLYQNMNCIKLSCIKK